MATGVFRPDQVWHDVDGAHINAHGGGVLHHDGVYYWFGEHKGEGRMGFQAQVGVNCYSSIDLYHWKKQGVALSVSDDPRSDIIRGCVIERPKAIYCEKTGRFVMWFHLELLGQRYNAARTGLAIADRPAGPYVFQHSLRPNAGHWPFNINDSMKEGSTEMPRSSRDVRDNWPRAIVDGVKLRQDFPGGQMSRDMTVFKDDDGKAYHITAAEDNRTLHVHELSEDYQSFTGRYARVLPGGANEAPAVFKWKNKYCLLTSGLTGWSPNAARAWIADSIYGPYRSLGNPMIGVNPHNGLGADKTFGGQSTFILPVAGKSGAFIAMFDVWRPDNPIEGGYIWLPVLLDEAEGFQIKWMDQWDLSVFDDPEN